MSWPCFASKPSPVPRGAARFVTDDETAILVRRAGDRCEYCRLPEWCYTGLFQIEHIVVRLHGGGDDVHNLARRLPPLQSQGPGGPG